MHSTKTEILALLKRSDGATVDEISSSVGLASMTVRQHLTALERDDLVRAQEVRRATGRPHFRYRLTDNGHRSISQGYDRLVVLLVDAVGIPNGASSAVEGADEGARRELFRRAAESLAGRHRAEIEMLAGKERIERIVAILRSHGGFAEYHEQGGAFELRDFSCVFRSIMGSGGPCEWHETFLRIALSEGVEPAPAPGDGCAACCRYTIPMRVAAAPATKG
jgi:predicted ArsR family transcriptional regulator